MADDADLDADLSLLFLTRVPSDYARITGRSEASAEAWPGRKAGTDRRSRLEQPCLREFQKGALGDVKRRQVRRFRPAEPVRIAP